MSNRCLNALREILLKEPQGKNVCSQKRNLYGSGALVPIYLNIHHLNSVGLWMLQSFNDLIVLCRGVPYLPLFRRLQLGVRCSSLGRPGLNFQVIASILRISQTSFMKSK